MWNGHSQSPSHQQASVLNANTLPELLVMLQGEEDVQRKHAGRPFMLILSSRACEVLMLSAWLQKLLRGPY